MAKKSFQGGSNVINMSKSILYNRGVLYFMAVLALGNLFMFLSKNDLVSVATFVLIGIITSFFSKNMVVILCISVVLSNIIRYGVKVRMEGFDEGFNEGLTDEEDPEYDEDMKIDTEDAEDLAEQQLNANIATESADLDAQMNEINQISTVGMDEANLQITGGADEVNAQTLIAEEEANKKMTSIFDDFNKQASS